MIATAEFSNADEKYTAGSLVSGMVKIENPHPVDIKKIEIKVQGYALSVWTVAGKEMDEKNGKKTWYTTLFVHQSTIIYASKTFVPWENESGAEFPGGDHEYSFEMQLPENVPTSFDGKHGGVRYCVQIEVDSQVLDMFYFNVSSPLDLRNIPMAVEPSMGFNRAEIGALLFKHGKIGLELHLPKSGYVPGESIVADVLIKNDSSRPVISGNFKLKQKIQYFACQDGWTANFEPGMHLPKNHDKKEEKKVIAEEKIVLDVKPKTEENIQVSLVVPPTIPSLEDCPAIRLHYYVVIEMQSQGMLNNTIQCSADVIIGTIKTD